jgi:hypothetical protein
VGLGAGRQEPHLPARLSDEFWAPIMAENLTGFMQELEKTEPPAFTAPQVRYAPREDSLSFFFRNDESYAYHLNNLVTLFLSFEGDNLVGCQVRGFGRKLESDGAFQVLIAKEGKVQLGLFFHLLAYDTAEPKWRNRLVELGQQAKGVEVDKEELVPSH